MKRPRIGILGGGMAGAVMAHLLAADYDVTVLEAEQHAGGLCSTEMFHGFPCDVGPHIIFSKNQQALDFLLRMGGDAMTTFTRSNQILYKGRMIKYPFENFLGLLPPEECAECARTYLQNPYEDYPGTNMLQFFLRTFGSGITNTYLRPYNEKIWKFDPAFMDTQMVGRIPKPPAEDVMSGAKGNYKEGYTHQSRFHYPRHGGVQTLFDQVVAKLPPGVRFLRGARVASIARGANGVWDVQCEDKRAFAYDRIVNCMPLHLLFPRLQLEVPSPVGEALRQLKYNSMIFGIALFSRDQAGDNFSLNLPAHDIIFHRISKLNFITPDAPPDRSAFLYEITYREGSSLAELSDEDIRRQVLAGFEKSGLAKSADLVDFMIRRTRFAYVIYDLNHRRNTDAVLAFLRGHDIFSCGRFAEFEYLNTDHIVERAFQRVAEIKAAG